jgi:hypothetical protein
VLPVPVGSTTWAHSVSAPAAARVRSPLGARSGVADELGPRCSGTQHIGAVGDHAGTSETPSVQPVTVIARVNMSPGAMPAMDRTVVTGTAVRLTVPAVNGQPSRLPSR